MRRLTIILLRVYQYVVSPLSPPSCRYWPCCSTYAIEAVEKHGTLKGLWMALLRLVRCNPWSSGGVDTVPENKSSGTQ